MLRVAVAVVELVTDTPPLATVTPVPETFNVAPEMKLVPAKLTRTDVPRRPEFGVIEVRVGVGGLATANVTLLVIAPPPFVTLTLWLPVAAVAVIWIVAVTVVPSALATMLLTMKLFAVPLKVIAVAPFRPLPVSV
jgi:hypothetical protein